MSESTVPTPAERYVDSVVTVSWIMVALHQLALLGIALNLHSYSNGTLRVARGASEAFRDGHRAGFLVGAVLGLLVHAIGAVWAPVNAYGLARRRPWALTSSLIYCAAELICCLPVGIFGLWTLTRPGVSNLFREQPSTHVWPPRA